MLVFQTRFFFKAGFLHGSFPPDEEALNRPRGLASERLDQGDCRPWPFTWLPCRRHGHGYGGR